MHASIVLASLMLLSVPALPAGAQGPQNPASLDINAKRPLPAGKYAVDLVSDSELGRDVRRLVMDKLAARGHEVGFSGGHVMRLQIDQTHNFSSGLTLENVLAPPRGEVRPLSERTDPRPPMPERRMQDLEPRARVSTEMMRITLTVRSAGSGEVVWTAYAACPVNEGRTLNAGRGMIDAIFANPNRTRRGEVKCPP